MTHHSTLKPFIRLLTAVVGGAYLDKGVEELLELVFFPVLEAGRTDLQDPIPVKLSCVFVWTFLAGCTRPRRKLAFLARARPERGEKKKKSMNASEKPGCQRTSAAILPLQVSCSHLPLPAEMFDSPLDIFTVSSSHSQTLSRET